MKSTVCNQWRLGWINRADFLLAQWAVGYSFPKEQINRVSELCRPADFGEAVKESAAETMNNSTLGPEGTVTNREGLSDQLNDGGGFVSRPGQSSLTSVTWNGHRCQLWEVEWFVWEIGGRRNCTEQSGPERGLITVVGLRRKSVYNLRMDRHAGGCNPSVTDSDTVIREWLTCQVIRYKGNGAYWPIIMLGAYGGRWVGRGCPFSTEWYLW